MEGVEWKKGMQRDCRWCGKDTVWVCITCTDGLHELCSICPEYTIPRKGPNKGVRVMHDCLSKHRRNPLFFPHRRRASGAKRKEVDPHAPQCSDVEEEDPDLDPPAPDEEED